MRRHIEFVLFYCFYLCVVLCIVAAFHPALCMGICLATDMTFVLYAWARFSDDETIHVMRKAIYALLIADMLVAAFVRGSIIPFIYLGPVLLGYLRLEGGFRNVKVS